MTTLKRYAVWSLDVWGNEEEGCDVNDRCKVGNITLSLDADDTDILLALEDAGYLKPGSHTVGLVEDYGTPYVLQISNKHDLRPWLTLELEEE